MAWVERTEGADIPITLVQIALAWRRVDEAAAEAWLLRSPLSEEARERARGRKRRRPQPEEESQPDAEPQLDEEPEPDEDPAQSG